MIYISNALKEKVLNIQNQKSNVEREIKILIKNQKKILESQKHYNRGEK